MPRKPAFPRGLISTAALNLLAAVLVACIIIYPSEAFKSSLGGLTLWWTIVFPALLPFLILSEILTGFGVVRALGVLFDPLMRRVFGIPGVGGWALAVGLVAGYPAGAGTAAKLALRDKMAPGEAERMLSLSHVCSPVTLVTVVGVGFLHSARAGLLLAAVHYAAALAAALLLRLLPARTRPAGGEAAPGSAGKRIREADSLAPAGREAAGAAGAPPVPARSVPKRDTPGLGRRPGLARRCARAMRQARAEDGRAFGKLLGDAVISAVQTLLAVGGFMIFFAVLNRMATLFVPALAPANSASFLPGLLEPHLGSYAASQTGASPSWIAACIGAFLGWSGLSLHAQVRSLIHKTGIRYAPFLIGRLLHAGLAFLLTLLFWNPMYAWMEEAKPSFLALPSGLPGAQADDSLPVLWFQSDGMLLGLLAVVAGLTVLSAFVAAYARLSRRLSHGRRLR